MKSAAKYSVGKGEGGDTGGGGAAWGRVGGEAGGVGAVWHGEVVPSCKVLIIVSMSEQRVVSIAALKKARRSSGPALTLKNSSPSSLRCGARGGEGMHGKEWAGKGRRGNGGEE